MHRFCPRIPPSRSWPSSNGVCKGTSRPQPSSYKSKDSGGANGFVEVCIHPVSVSDQRLFVNIREVANIRKLENEVRESEEIYRCLVEQSQDIIFVLRGERAIFANSRAFELLGEELRGPNIRWSEHLNRVYPAEDRSRLIQFFTRAIRHPDESSFTEFSLLDKAGSLQHMALSTGLIDYRGQKALTGILRNITESKRLEERLKVSEKLATLAQFTASVAHEIRNPLEALTSAVLLLSRSLELEGENKELLDVVQNASSEINSAINQLVSTVNNPPYHFLEVDTRACLKRSIRIVKKCKDFSPKIKMSLSCSRTVASIYGDEDQLVKGLVNIISNACQAVSGEGSVRIRATNSEVDSKRAVRITVRDTGGGIPPDIGPQVWEPFVSTKQKGMGMGLFIAKRIMEDHSGDIVIRSTSERGTAVQISLPAFEREG